MLLRVSDRAQKLAEEAICGHGAVQKLPELAEFAESLLSAPPLAWALEIGSHSGGMLWFFAQIVTNGVISIDLHPGPPIGPLPHPLFRITGDSHSVLTKDMMPTKHLDLLFIDGDHTYAGVKQDFEMYGPLVRPGGLICFHDIVPHTDLADCGPSQLWAELTGDKWDTVWHGGHEMMNGVVLPQASCGIGVLRV